MAHLSIHTVISLQGTIQSAQVMAHLSLHTVISLQGTIQSAQVMAHLSIHTVISLQGTIQSAQVIMVHKSNLCWKHCKSRTHDVRKAIFCAPICWWILMKYAIHVHGLCWWIVDEICNICARCVLMNSPVSVYIANWTVVAVQRPIQGLYYRSFFFLFFSICNRCAGHVLMNSW